MLQEDEALEYIADNNMWFIEELTLFPEGKETGNDFVSRTIEVSFTQDGDKLNHGVLFLSEHKLMELAFKVLSSTFPEALNEEIRESSVSAWKEYVKDFESKYDKE